MGVQGRTATGRHEVPLPARMTRLPRNKAGYVVPWFVAWIDGEPDFRVVRAGGIRDALWFELCWLCGQHIGRYATFVIGPMCAVNRVSSEPPSHRECASYAAQVCPFLTTPSMTRRENLLPEHMSPAGEMIRRNPGVALCWTTRDWSTFHVPTGVLMNVGEPEAVEWWAHGRPATRDEVQESIDTGLPTLREVAEEDGPEAIIELNRQVESARRLLPVAS